MQYSYSIGFWEGEDMGKEFDFEESVSVDELLRLIDAKMEGGVSRLSVRFSDEQEAGTKVETHHHGRCDVGSPWAKGTVSNCEVADHLD